MPTYLDQLKPSPYFYYDTPDGKDLNKKLGYMVRNCYPYGFMAAYIGTFNMVKPVGYFPTFITFSKIWAFGTFVGFPYAISVYMATNLRGKDDYVNGCIGGITSGICIGQLVKNGAHGFFAALTLGTIGAGLKQLKLDGVEVSPDCSNLLLEGGIGILDPHKWEFSFYKPRPKGWIRAEDEK